MPPAIPETNLSHLFDQKTLADIAEQRSEHQFNPEAVRHVRTLTTLAGLQRIGLHVVRLEPGCLSTEFHYHDNDEEFLVILAGRGVATIGEQRHEVVAGDIMAFPAQSPAHELANPYSEDLLYVMGGEKNHNDVVHYPRLKRSLIKTAGNRFFVDHRNQHELPPKF